MMPVNFYITGNGVSLLSYVVVFLRDLYLAQCFDGEGSMVSFVHNKASALPF